MSAEEKKEEKPESKKAEAKPKPKASPKEEPSEETPEELFSDQQMAFLAKLVETSVRSAVLAAIETLEARSLAKEAAAKAPPPPPRLLSKEEFEKLPPEESAPCVVTKEDFIQLTPLSEMTTSAAEATYGRWLGSGRIKETRTVIPSDGTTPDQVSITVEGRFVHHENRRRNQNKRITEETKAAGFDTRPMALRK